ncbi:glucokinase [Endothiovibrio diazotrophicus]
MKVLAGDLGGTKTLLAIVECVDAGGGTVRCEPLLEHRYPSEAWAGLEPMLRDFLEAAGGLADGVAYGCIGVAGPVDEEGAGERAAITNLPWSLESGGLAEASGLSRLRLINDFQAIGYGIEALGAEALHTLQAGTPRPRGPRAVIGAGTGLGQALQVWCDGYYEVLPTEGGHASFAPQDEEQQRLLAVLRETFGHVSYERLVSGQGLVNIHRFLEGSGLAAGEALRVAMAAGDAAAAISEAALAGSDPSAIHALELFVRIYGAQAGNLALTTVCSGGLFVAGGIAPKILHKLQEVAFLEAFNAKGRMAKVTATIPVHVVTEPRVGLFGAALAASRL